ncbi:MAG: Type 1 glutamine amidotransferase-like domain-containing protein [Anaerolineae bacterium]
MLVGGGSWREDETGDVDAAALGWADLDRPTAVLPTAGQSIAEAEALVEYYTDLGGPQGYVVPIFDAAGAQLTENRRLLRDAGLICVSDGPDVLALVRALRGSPALHALVQAFEDGAVIVGMGAGAAALGAWIEDPGISADEARRAVPAWGWLPSVIVAAHFKGTEVSDGLRRLLNLRPNCLGLGVPDQVALGLGPGGEVESVGPGQVTVVVSGLEVEA